MTLRTLVLSPAPLVFVALAAAVVSGGRETAPGLSRLLLHPRALPALLFGGGEADRPRLLLRARLSARVPARRRLLRARLREGPARGPTRRSFSWSGSRSSSSSFPCSGSKLPPYLFPAIPAAAVLAARGLPETGARGAWILTGPAGHGSRRRSRRPSRAARERARAPSRGPHRAGARDSRSRVLVRGSLRRKRSEARPDLSRLCVGRVSARGRARLAEDAAGPLHGRARRGRARGGGSVEGPGRARGLQGLPERGLVGAEDPDPRRRVPGRARAAVRDRSRAPRFPVLERGAFLGARGRAAGPSWPSSG